MKLRNRVECRGTANALDQAIAGRVVAGLGGAGMTALVSVIITGIPPSSLRWSKWLTLAFYSRRYCISWSGSCTTKLCQLSCSTGQERRSSTGRTPCGYYWVEMVSGTFAANTELYKDLHPLYLSYCHTMPQSSHGHSEIC